MVNYESSQDNELHKVFCNIEKDKVSNKSMKLKEKTLKQRLELKNKTLKQSLELKENVLELKL